MRDLVLYFTIINDLLSTQTYIHVWWWTWERIVIKQSQVYVLKFNHTSSATSSNRNSSYPSSVFGAVSIKLQYTMIYVFLWSRHLYLLNGKLQDMWTTSPGLLFEYFNYLLVLIPGSSIYPGQIGQGLVSPTPLCVGRSFQ